MSYNKERENPIIWWLSINVDENNDELQQFALRLFAISPSQAVCERNFSALKWFFGDRRTKLHVSRVEAMAKIRSYYISNSNKELKYYGKELNETELKDSFYKSSIIYNYLEETNINKRNEVENEDLSTNNTLEIADLVDLTLPEFTITGDSLFEKNDNQLSRHTKNIGNMIFDTHSLV